MARGVDKQNFDDVVCCFEHRKGPLQHKESTQISNLSAQKLTSLSNFRDLSVAIMPTAGLTTASNTGKTPHRRRRKTPASAIEKENGGSASHNVPVFADDQDVVFEKTQNALAASDDGEAGAVDVQRASREMKSALDNLTSSNTIISSMWQTEPALLESVIQLSLIERGDVSSRSQELVKDHSSGLLKEAKALIQKVQADSKTHSRGVLDQSSFIVALHCVRAVVQQMTNMSNSNDDMSLKVLASRRETCIKLLYHLIASASTYHDTPNSKLKAAWIVLSAVEALQWGLLNYTCYSENGEMTYFEAGAQGFVVPVGRTGGFGATTSSTTMTLRQVVTIGLKSYLAATTAIHNLNSKLRNDSEELNDVTLCGTRARRWSRMFSHIFLPAAYRPWISFVHAAPRGSSECLKDIVGHAKAGHRLLWDIAAKSKSLGPSALQIRRAAILIIIPFAGSKQPLNISNNHVREIFDAACGYAWKAASVEAQSISGVFPVPNTELASFHAEIGSRLDKVVAGAPNQDAGLSYAEYCVYRALHCATLPTNLYNGDFPFGTPILSAILVAIQAQHRLFDTKLVMGGIAYNNSSGGDIRSYCMTLAGSIRSITQDAERLPLDVHNRYFKLISALSFHRVIFQALKNDTLREDALEILSIVLSQCLGPLMCFFSRTLGRQDKLKQETMIEAGVECYVRPLAAFERLRQGSSGMETAQSRFEVLADQTVSQMYHAFLLDDPISSGKLLEKCAKSMTTLARQRLEHDSKAQSSTLPSLYALAIYRHLSEHHASESEQDGDEQYQLAARLAQLASELQANELYDEAMIVLSCVLAQELPFCYTGTVGVENWSNIDFVEFLASRCKHALSPVPSDQKPTPLTKTGIRRLVGVLEARSRGEREVAQMSGRVLVAWQRFLESMGCATIDEGDQCSSEAKLLINVLSCLSVSKPIDYTRICLLLVDVMVDIGATLGKSDQSSWQLDICRNISTDMPLARVPSLTSSTDFISIVVQAVSATCLIPGKVIDFSKISLKNKEDDSALDDFGFAAEVLDEILSSLQLRSRSNDLNVEFILVTIIHFAWFVRSDRNDQADRELFAAFEAAMGLYGDRVDLVQDNGDFDFCRRSFLWALAHFQCYLESHGDTVRSVISMHWILDLSKHGDDMEGAWSTATAASVFLSNPLSISSFSCLSTWETDPNEECLLGSNPWFLQVEINLSLARCKLTIGSDRAEVFSEVIVSVEQVLQEANSYDACEAGEQDARSKWILSSAHLTMAECFAASGNFDAALRYVQESCRLCMAVVSLVRISHSSSEEHAHWDYISRSTLLSRAKYRYSDLLAFRSRLYSRVGDHRKAVAYLGTLSEYLGVELGKIDRETGIDVQQLLAIRSGIDVKHFQRLNTELRCSILPHDSVASEVIFEPSWLQVAWSNSDDVSQQIHVILDVLSGKNSLARKRIILVALSRYVAVEVGDILYGESIKSPFQASFQSFYREAMTWFSKSLDTNSLLGAFEKVTGSNNTRLSAKIALREVRCILALEDGPTSQADSDDKLTTLCTLVLNNTAADPTDRAWALFYSANRLIVRLRESGSLSLLWSDGEDRLPPVDEEMLREARSLLTSAINSHSIGSDILSRLLLRTLALVSGPETGPYINTSSGALVLMSIGQTYRQQMIRSLASDENERSDRVDHLVDIFDLFEGSGISGDGIAKILEALAKVSPSNWKYVATTLCPSGDLLVTAIAKSAEEPSTMCMKTSRIESFTPTRSSYDDILVPLDRIIQESQDQLQGMDVSSVSERFGKEEMKRQWWDARFKLDEDLQALLERVELDYFPSLHICGDTGESIFSSAEDSPKLPIGNLASRFEAVVEAEPQPDETDESLRKLTVPKLKERLREEFGFSDSRFRKMKKQDLVDLYLQEIANSKRASASPESASTGCLFLILDENLHRFPFEGMPSLEGHAVCRVPSLSFVLAGLFDRPSTLQQQTRQVDPSSASYVLDPENNLLSTRDRLRPTLERIAAEHDWRWSAAIGEVPPATFFEEGLRQEDGLFMYFGHGGAQTCFSRKSVENLISRRDGHDARDCKSTVVLMGCSSGRLVSVNRKHSQSVEQIPLYYEPEGVALSYLCAGAPCVVGNLWDVTDRDIDRYSMTLLDLFLEKNDGASLASCVARSRSACKLRYIVGCAPVCYGVPVHLIEK